MKHLSDELFNEYLDGILSPEVQQEVDRHLADCANCRDLLADLHLVDAALEALGDQIPPRNMASMVIGKLQRRRIPVLLEIALSVQAGLALGLLIIFSDLGLQLLKINGQMGLPILFKINWAETHIFQPHLQMHVPKFIGVPLPGLTLGLLALFFAFLVVIGNYRLLTRGNGK
ncbi:hypothetical protein SDC9_95361 [bioreactor metagenome]|uniref:Putative zinc-finger domain-containing protein n=1 Tax=bioreactor metagenome TaxID=1076179 RepID=A0A645A632_9ZZZZ